MWGGTTNPVETSLWTNSSPASNFAPQDVSLSQDISNFDCIKFYFRVSTSNSNEYAVMASVSDFKNAVLGTAGKWTLVLSGRQSASDGSKRIVTYKSNTSITFNNASTWSSTTANNAYAIPTKIAGIKY